jgi:hypothetical protein
MLFNKKLSVLIFECSLGTQSESCKHKHVLNVLTALRGPDFTTTPSAIKLKKKYTSVLRAWAFDASAITDGWEKVSGISSFRHGMTIEPHTPSVEQMVGLLEEARGQRDTNALTGINKGHRHFLNHITSGLKSAIDIEKGLL